jgi:hypothetical protein
VIDRLLKSFSPRREALGQGDSVLEAPTPPAPVTTSDGRPVRAPGHRRAALVPPRPGVAAPVAVGVAVSAPAVVHRPAALGALRSEDAGVPARGLAQRGRRVRTGPDPDRGRDRGEPRGTERHHPQRDRRGDSRGRWLALGPATVQPGRCRPARLPRRAARLRRRAGARQPPDRGLPADDGGASGAGRAPGGAVRRHRRHRRPLARATSAHARGDLPAHPPGRVPAGGLCHLRGQPERGVQPVPGRAALHRHARPALQRSRPLRVAVSLVQPATVAARGRTSAGQGALER